MSVRSFPPPWTVEKIPSGLKVCLPLRPRKDTAILAKLYPCFSECIHHAACRFLLSALGCCRYDLFGYRGVRAYSGLARLRRIALQTRFAQRPDSLVANLTKANRSLLLWILSSERIQGTECQE
jgi:hypothetical protein